MSSVHTGEGEVAVTQAHVRGNYDCKFNCSCDYDECGYVRSACARGRGKGERGRTGRVLTLPRGERLCVGVCR